MENKVSVLNRRKKGLPYTTGTGKCPDKACKKTAKVTEKILRSIIYCLLLQDIYWSRSSFSPDLRAGAAPRHLLSCRRTGGSRTHT